MEQSQERVETKKESIPCLHETGEEKDSGKKVPDYHPLSKEQVASLLDKASRSNDVSYISSIQVRLAQGIRGMVCPRDIDGEASEKNRKLDELFVGRYKKGSSPQLVERLFGLMQ